MRAYWRGNTPLQSHADWRGRLGKNSKHGTSAPTLATAWAGPVEVMGALRRQPALEGLRLTQIAAEAQSAVDEFSGPRNHDLVVLGQLPNAERVVVCIEAKAGESFGVTVKQQTAAAQKAGENAAAEDKSSNATARLGGLLKRFVWHDHQEQRVQDMRYQLLTALAGTLAEAEQHDAKHAVLMVHEFLTDQRDDEQVLEEHHWDLHRFMTTVMDCEPPSSEVGPWCIDVSGAAWADGRTVYVARAVTDLRTDTLEASAS